MLNSILFLNTHKLKKNNTKKLNHNLEELSITNGIMDNWKPWSNICKIKKFIRKAHSLKSFIQTFPAMHHGSTMTFDTIQIDMSPSYSTLLAWIVFLTNKNAEAYTIKCKQNIHIIVRDYLTFQQFKFLSLETKQQKLWKTKLYPLTENSNEIIEINGYIKIEHIF